MTPIRVVKCDAHGRAVFAYNGEVIERSASGVFLRAYFARDDVDAGYLVYKRGDLFLEWFYTDRHYNVFKMYDADDGRLKGWYCNITRPAVIETANGRLQVRADDLALDIYIAPDGAVRMLDEDEFEALDLSPDERRAALDAAAAICRLAAERVPPFDP
jgi:predicted RNA-binding protein associated with RNAse of E/G family